MHHTNLNGKSSIFYHELINGEKHCLKGIKPFLAAALNIFNFKNFSFTR